MRYDTLFRYQFKYDHLTPVINGNVVTYQLDHTDYAKLIPGSVDSMTLVTQQPLEVGGKVRNVLDSQGTPVFVTNGQPYDMWVHASLPQFDFDGVIKGWKQTLRRTAPRDVEVMLASIAEGATS